jgi:hypothetical protein
MDAAVPLKEYAPVISKGFHAPGSYNKRALRPSIDAISQSEMSLPMYVSEFDPVSK